MNYEKCHVCNKRFYPEDWRILIIYVDSEGNMGAFLCESCVDKDSSTNPILVELEKSYRELE